MTYVTFSTLHVRLEFSRGPALPLPEPHGPARATSPGDTRRGSVFALPGSSAVQNNFIWYRGVPRSPLDDQKLTVTGQNRPHVYRLVTSRRWR